MPRCHTLDRDQPLFWGDPPGIEGLNSAWNPFSTETSTSHAHTGFGMLRYHTLDRDQPLFWRDPPGIEGLNSAWNPFSISEELRERVSEPFSERFVFTPGLAIGKC
jgi:hypothetical protein